MICLTESEMELGGGTREVKLFRSSHGCTAAVYIVNFRKSHAGWERRPDYSFLVSPITARRSWQEPTTTREQKFGLWYSKTRILCSRVTTFSEGVVNSIRCDGWWECLWSPESHFITSQWSAEETTDMLQPRHGEELKWKFSREHNVCWGLLTHMHTCTPNKPDVFVLQGKI